MLDFFYFMKSRPRWRNIGPYSHTELTCGWDAPPSKRDRCCVSDQHSTADLPVTSTWNGIWDGSCVYRQVLHTYAWVGTIRCQVIWILKTKAMVMKCLACAIRGLIALGASAQNPLQNKPKLF